MNDREMNLSHNGNDSMSQIRFSTHTAANTTHIHTKKKKVMTERFTH